MPDPTEHDEFYLPEDVPEGRCGVTTAYGDSSQLPGDVTCWRPTWDGATTGRCIWHADVADKPAEELAALRNDSWERLDGAILRDTALEDTISFDSCGLFFGDLTGADLQEASFVAGSLRQADLTDANLLGGQFGRTSLVRATMSHADLRDSDLTEAYIRSATLQGAHLLGADLSGAGLHGADLTDVRATMATCSETDFQETTLTGADFGKANLSGVNLTLATLTGASFSAAELSNAGLNHADAANVDLSGADLSGAELASASMTDGTLTQAILVRTDLSRTEFTGANLDDTRLDDAAARGASFRDATLEDAVLTRTDLREADLTGAAIYQAQLADVRINAHTAFGTTCVYETMGEDSVEVAGDRVAALTAATWVYRRLETLHEANAMADRSQAFHIRKEEAQRQLDWQQEAYGPWAVGTVNWYLTKHGESIQRLLVAWAATIVTAGLLYPFVGGVEDNGTTYEIVVRPEVPTVSSLVGALDALVRGLYFSTITFTTIGYANVAPQGFGSRILVSIESLVGAILIALFVYVLGRRVAR